MALANPEKKPFELPRTDSTYWGRVTTFVRLFSPSTLLTTDAEFERAKTLLKQYQDNALPADITHADLVKSKQLVDAVAHPDTGEKIFPLFRMSAFVPANIPICYGLITAQTPLGQMTWQFINQSFNAATNYSNRTIDPKKAMPLDQLATSYLAATATSCGIGAGVSKLAQRANTMQLSGTVRSLIRGIVPFTAVAAAGTLNVFLMRQSDIREGIDVKDQDGNVLGKSKAAGWSAVSQVAASRIVTALPVCVLPPWLEEQIASRPAVARLLASSPGLRLPLQISLIAGCLWAALPMAIGIFPQQASLPVSALEPEYQGRTTPSGAAISTVFFNKGL